MSGILRLESLTKGNTLKQGDKTPLKYRLFDADGEQLDIAGKTAKVRLVYPDFLTIGYEKDGLTVAQDDTVTFTIDSVIPSRIYHVEIIVDDKFIFPSRADESKFTVDKSSLGTEANIIEVVGVDQIVNTVLGRVDADISQAVTDINATNDAIQQAEQERAQGYQEIQQIIEDGALSAVPKDGSVTPEKTSFFKQSKNLFNKDSVTPNMRVANPNGYLFAVEGVSTSELIRVVPNSKYTRSHVPEAFAFFEEDGTTFISGGYSNNTTQTFTTPANAHWIRLTVPSDLLDVFQFEAGDKVTSYVRYFGEFAEDITIPTITPDMTDFFTYYPVGKNLLDISLSVKGKQLTSDGSLVDSYQSNYDTTPFIEATPSDTITISRASGTNPIVRCILFYDENQVAISSTFEDRAITALEYTFTVPDGAFGYRISYDTASTFVQIEQGNSKTSYEPFTEQEQIDTKYIPKTSAGNTPINAVPADGSITTSKIADKAITGEKTDFFKHSKNLFNKNTAIDGMGWNYATGESYAPMEGFSGSDWMQVKPNTTYTKNDRNAVVFYDGLKSYISGTGVSDDSVSFTTPANCVYIKITVPTVKLDTLQLEEGIESTSYEPYGSFIDTKAIRDESLTPNKMSFFEEQGISRNLFNPNDADFLEGTIITSDGVIDRPAYMTTGFIPVDNTSYVTLSMESGTLNYIRAYVLYDETFQPISYHGTATSGNFGSTVSTVSASYIRLSTTSDGVNIQIEHGTEVSPYEPYSLGYVVQERYLPNRESNDQLENYNSNPWYGKKVVWNGDSITAGYEAQRPFFADIVANNLGMTSVNYAIGGSTISVKEGDPTLRNPIVIRYEEMDDDADLIIIAGGTNDHSYSQTPVGTMGDRTNHTFYGALHNLCLGLINKYVGKQILFMTPIERYRDRLTTDGHSLADYSDIIQEVCGYYGIPVLDSYREISLNMDIPAQADAFFADTGGHPNQAGHEVMARRITGYLKQLA